MSGGFPSGKPPYAPLWKSSTWRIQLVSGFHLGKIWATNPIHSYRLQATVRAAKQPRYLAASRRILPMGGTRALQAVACPSIRTHTNAISPSRV